LELLMDPNWSYLADLMFYKILFVISRGIFLQINEFECFYSKDLNAVHFFMEDKAKRLIFSITFPMTIFSSS
jgi:hypothetical protein